MSATSSLRRSVSLCGSWPMVQAGVGCLLGRTYLSGFAAGAVPPRLISLVSRLSSFPGFIAALLQGRGLDGGEFLVVQLAVAILVELLQLPVRLGRIIFADGVLLVGIQEAIVIFIILGKQVRCRRVLPLPGGGLNGGDFLVVQLAIMVLVESLEVAIRLCGVVFADGLLLIGIYDAIVVLVVLGKELGLRAVRFGGDQSRGDSPTEQAEAEGDDASFLHGGLLCCR